MQGQSTALEKIIVHTISLDFKKKHGTFTLNFGDQRFSQNVCEFLLTYSFIVGQKIEEYLLNPANEYDSIRIPLSVKGHVLDLSLSEFISLREVYLRQNFLLKLEDVLLHRGVSFSVSL